MITAPASLLAFLMALLAALLWIARVPALASVFRVLPPIIWCYFLPMLAGFAGVIPNESPLYDAMSYYGLPFTLALLIISIDVPAITRLGRPAVVMMLTGAVGIALGCMVSFYLVGGMLPAGGWQGLAALSGSWIGGSANMIAIQQSLEAPPEIVGPVVLIDAVLGYGWMGVLIFLAAFKARLNGWLRTSNRMIDDVEAAFVVDHPQPMRLEHIAAMVGIGALSAIGSRALGDILPVLGDPVIVSHSTWAIVVVVTVGLVLSATPVRRLDRHGMSTVGYLGLYFLAMTIGAQARSASAGETASYFLAGGIVLLIHIGLLLLVARWRGYPFFFVATGSMANIGGAASAPIVAAAYERPLAPVGLLMALGGYAVGTYAALLTAHVLGQMAG